MFCFCQTLSATKLLWLLEIHLINKEGQSRWILLILSQDLGADFCLCGSWWGSVMVSFLKRQSQSPLDSDFTEWSDWKWWRVTKQHNFTWVVYTIPMSFEEDTWQKSLPGSQGLDLSPRGEKKQCAQSSFTNNRFSKGTSPNFQIVGLCL